MPAAFARTDVQRQVNKLRKGNLDQDTKSDNRGNPVVG